MAHTIYSKAGADTAIAAAVAAITPPDLSGYVLTTDPRLSDDRDPTAHTHAIADTTGLQSALDGKAASAHAHAAADITSGTLAAARLPVASTTASGVVELATTAEASAGADTTRAVTPAGVAAAIAGVGGGVTDHGALSGLADDDHTIYALADGTRGAFAPTSHTHTASQISDSTATGRTLMTAATATAARTAISAAPALGSDDNYVTDAEKVKLANLSGTNTGDQDLTGYATTASLATVATTGAYADLTGKPTIPDSPDDIGAAPALGADDNYVTDAQLARLSTSDTKTVNTITAAASVTVSTAYAVNKLVMTQDTTITPSLTAGSDPITALHLSGAFVPTWAASIDWPDGTAPTYTSPALYVFLTVDAGTSWVAVQSAKAIA